LIEVVLQNQVNLAIRPDGSPDRAGQLGENVRRGVVNDRVNCVQAQPIEMVFSQPVERVMDKEIPHGSAFIAIEVDGATPWCVVALGKKLRSIGI